MAKQDKGPRVQPGSLGWALFRDEQEGHRDPIDHPASWYADDDKPEPEKPAESAAPAFKKFKTRRKSD